MNLSYRPVKTKDMVMGKIYYHYSSQFNNARFVRLTEKITDSDHLTIISSSYYTKISNDKVIERYVNMEWQQRQELEIKLNDDVMHPDSVISEKFNIPKSMIDIIRLLKYHQPRRKFFDQNILLEITNIDEFPFKVKLEDESLCMPLKRADIRQLKIEEILK